MKQPPAQPIEVGLQTETVRASIADDPSHGAVIPPLYLSTNFRFDGVGKTPAFDYTRSGNPTRESLNGLLRELEGGVRAVATSSGMSAVALVLQLVGRRDLVVAAHDCYGGTRRLLTALAEKEHFLLKFSDLTDPGEVESALALEPRLVWAETPSNPLLRITDLEALASKAGRAGALTVVDNTLLSPAGQRPLQLGIDLVVHSTTKFINGHSDIIGGAAVTSSAELGEELAWWANSLGITQSPFDSFLALRGARTLFARTNQHEVNGRAIAQALDEHPAVSRTHYPGLAHHPGHALALDQQHGFGSLVSFELAGGTAVMDEFVSNLRCFTLAESLGGVESLICHPATMSHGAIPVEARARAGISDALLRISAGIEETGDLVSDLVGSLDAVVGGGSGGGGGTSAVGVGGTSAVGVGGASGVVVGRGPDGVPRRRRPAPKA